MMKQVFPLSALKDEISKETRAAFNQLVYCDDIVFAWSWSYQRSFHAAQNGHKIEKMNSDIKRHRQRDSHRSQ